MKKIMSIFFLVLVMVLIHTVNVDAKIVNQLSWGSDSSSVYELQNNLKSIGFYKNNLTGEYDNNTYLAVKSFQVSKGLSSTGILDFTTLNALNKVINNETELIKPGMRNERVRELQTYLYSLKYLNVQPTGYFGNLTLSALNSLQKNNGFTQTNYANNSTFSQIFSVIDKAFSPYETYIKYTVIKGDTIWSIATKNNLTTNDIIKANKLTKDYLDIGQVIKIPKKIIPVKPHYYKYGEYLNWFESAQYVFPIGQNAKVIDFFSGKSFNIRRTIGSGHADCETLTSTDTAVMKQIFEGKWSWQIRPILLVVNGRTLSASMAGMPHAGLDSYAGGINISNRSDSYGYGTNFDYIKGNNMDGHFDIHFPGSLRHKDWQIDPRHQDMIKISSNR